MLMFAAIVCLFFNSRELYYLFSLGGYSLAVGAVVTMSSSGVDVNAQFIRNQRYFLGLAILVIVKVAMMAMIGTVKCQINESAEQGDDELSLDDFFLSDVCATRMEYAYFILFLPALPYCYLLVRFKYVVEAGDQRDMRISLQRNHKEGVPLASEIWIYSALLEVVSWAVSSVYMAIITQNPYWIVMSIVNAQLFISCLWVYRRSIARGESASITLYMVIYAQIPAGIFHTGSAVLVQTVVNAGKSNSTPLVRVVNLLLAVVFVLLLFFCMYLYSTYYAAVKGDRLTERIYRECLRARPPLPFPKSEFVVLWRHCQQKFKEDRLIEELLNATEFCLTKPSKYWSYLEECIFPLPIFEDVETFSRLQDIAESGQYQFQRQIEPIVMQLMKEDEDKTGGKIFNANAKIQRVGSLASITRDVRMPLLELPVTKDLVQMCSDEAFKRYVDETVLAGLLVTCAERAFDNFKEALRDALPRATMEKKHSEGVGKIRVRCRRDKSVKSMPRLRAKVEEYAMKAQKRGTANDEFPFSAKIGDVLRASVTVENAEDMVYVWEQLKKKFVVVRMKNKFLAARQSIEKFESIGFPDIHANVLFDVPGVEKMQIIAEIQIHLRFILEIGRSDHKLYEIVRAESMRSLLGLEGKGGDSDAADFEPVAQPTMLSILTGGNIFGAARQDRSTLRVSSGSGSMFGSQASSFRTTVGSGNALMEMEDLELGYTKGQLGTPLLDGSPPWAEGGSKDTGRMSDSDESKRISSSFFDGYVSEGGASADISGASDTSPGS
jgi:hypothetical protein